MARINPSKKQIEYWQARNERTFLEGEKNILDYAESLKKQYEKASKTIEEEIQKFYGKFAVDNKYTMADLKKLLNRDELKDFKKSIKDIADYAKEHKFDKDYETQIKLLRAKSRISRLDELQTKINFEVEKLYNDVNISLGEQLEQSFEDGYYKTIFNNQKFLGFSDNFAMLNQKAIQKAVTTPYMTENYSDVLWKNKTNLMNILNQQIPQGIILGYNPRKTAQIASRQLGSKYTSTVRLVRTEYNLILNDATAQGYAESGIDRYQLLATLDSRTSDICREMDGEIFKVKEKEVGINYPPFHPNCRTTTIPYFEPDEFDTEIEQYIKDEDGYKHRIEDETDYLEWKNALKENKNGTAIYENKAANFQPVATREEAITKFKDILGAKQVDLGKMKLEVANEYLEGTNIFLNEYPELKNFITNIDTNIKTAGTLGIFQSGNKYGSSGHIAIDTKIGNFPTISFRSPKDLEKFYNNRKYSISTKYQYEGFTGKSVAAHELTHALQEYIFRLEKGLKGFDEVQGHLTDNYIAKDIILQARREVFGDFYGTTAYEGTKYLGKYAQTNFNEQLAQAVSYELTAGTNPYSAKVKELLSKRLKEALKK